MKIIIHGSQDGVQSTQKNIKNSLKSLNLSEKLQEDSIFALRPEQLAVEDFIHLTQKIAADGI